MMFNNGFDSYFFQHLKNWSKFPVQYFLWRYVNYIVLLDVCALDYECACKKSNAVVFDYYDRVGNIISRFDRWVHCVVKKKIKITV